MLVDKGIPINSFYIGKSESQFKALSERTNGKARVFPEGRRDASNKMSNFFVESIMKIADHKLDAIGVKNAGL